ncbi:MAG: hypothetical protein ACRDPI_08985 [Nocardioidaceae bacterium]
MIDDEHVRDRFDTLRRESSIGVRPPPSFDKVRARSRSHAARRRLVTAGVVLGVVIAVMAVSQLADLTGEAPAPLSPIQPVAPTARHGSADFGPQAASFVSANKGWVLAAGACSHCGILSETTDGGHTWDTTSSVVRLPGTADDLAGGELDMFFASAKDGYIFASNRCSSACVIMTKNGGATWTPAALPATSELIMGASIVYAFSEGESGRSSRLFSSTPGTSSWKQLALPANIPTNSQVSIAADGDSVALLEHGDPGPSPTNADLGRLWTSATHGQTWTARTNPCTVTDGGAALISMAPGHPRALLIDCFNNEQSQQAQHTRHHVYGSGNGGTSWVRLADPTHMGDPTLLVDNGSGHAFLATQSGGANTLAATLDGGLSWHPAITNSGGFLGWADLRFINSSVGFVLGPTHYAPTHLYRTQDAGKTWASIALPTTQR